MSKLIPGNHKHLTLNDRIFIEQSLQSIRNLNLLATLAAGYIGLTSSAHSESIYRQELKKCAKRIYEVPKFLFYALGYAIERVLSMSRKGINGFLTKKAKSQQLNLF